MSVADVFPEVKFVTASLQHQFYKIIDISAFLCSCMKYVENLHHRMETHLEPNYQIKNITPNTHLSNTEETMEIHTRLIKRYIYHMYNALKLNYTLVKTCFIKNN